MNSIFAAIEKLYPELTKNKKLALAWVVFIAAFGWVIYFAQTYPSEKARLDHFMVEMDALDTDFASSMVIYDIVSPQILESIEVRIYFLENFSGKYPYDTVKPEVIAQGYEQVEGVLSGIASARGIMNGTNFSMQELNTYKEGFTQDLTLMETYLKDYQSFYLAIMRGDAKEALNISANFESSSAVESINGFRSRLENFSKETEIAIDKRIVDIEEKIGEVTLFNLKKLLTWITSLYMLIFIPSVIIYHRRIQLKLNRKKEKQKRKMENKTKSKPNKTG